jgi:GNAT superfamily N-acetyltransferase
MADLPAMYAAYGEEQAEIYGGFSQSIEEYEKEWLMFGFHPETDCYAAWIDGQIAGYVEVRVFRSIPVRPNMYGYVRPAFRGRGIGSNLLAWARERAAQYIPQCPPEARVTLNGFSPREEGRQLLLDHGYVQTRQSYTMAIDFDDYQHPLPELPAGFRFQSMAEGATLEDMVYLYQETFRDHRGAIDEPLEAALGRWQSILDARVGIDPHMIVRVLHGDIPAGMMFAFPTDEGDQETAFIETLGVMPAYRKRGLGMALVRLGFHLAQARGRKHLLLGVDGASLTGAVRLYERAGMYIKTVYHVLELEIRPGVEISNQG